jgi:penicillin-binding protein 1A
MIYMLMGGVEEAGGTSIALPYDLKKDNEIGGKTGTTNNASDGWYMGVTHNLVSGAWVGGDERTIHYREWSLGQGGKTARPIWASYMTRIYADPTIEYKKDSSKGLQAAWTYLWIAGRTKFLLILSVCPTRTGIQTIGNGRTY